jgi:NADPH2:quinone reductase
MKELLISAGPKVTMIESPVPIPGPGQIVIKVVVCGANPKDWKRPEWQGTNINQGDDIAGIVHLVGEDVVEFKVSFPCHISPNHSVWRFLAPGCRATLSYAKVWL